MRRFMGVLAIAAIAASWPTLASASDQDTAQQIAGSLRASGQLVDYSVGVKYDNGTAVLLGRVANEEQREKATALVKQMPMVSNVVNKLEIKPTRAAASSPAATLRFNSAGSEAAQPSANVVYPETMPTNLGANGDRVNLTGAQTSQPTTLFGSLGNILGGKPKPTTNTNRVASNPMRQTAPTANGSYNDPGDPLVRSQSGRFAAQPSRRYAAEPNYNAAPNAEADETAASGPADPLSMQAPVRFDASGEQAAVSKVARQPRQSQGQVQLSSGTDAPRGKITQVAQLEAESGDAGMQPSAGPVARIPARPASQTMYQPAPQTQAMQVSTQAQVPAMQAGYHARRYYGPPLPYGPAMSGCPGGACAAPAMEQPNMPNYAWPSYASYPNYAAVSYPKQYSPTAWPYIGPFYPYPQVPLGWRKVALEWDDGWWFLDFYDHHCHH